MDHGWMSQKYRRNWRTPLTTAAVITRDAINIFGVEAVLRNGPRILRACEAMRVQLAAEQEATHE